MIAPAIQRVASLRRKPHAPRSGRGFRVERGSLADYLALARFHYQRGHPRGVGLVLRLIDARNGTLAGVLVVCRPTLNGAWRAAAFGGRFSGSDRRGVATRINRELRVISRVVIDPRYRGLGAATRLVRAYVRRPLTRFTEAVAAMGDVSPFFGRAGMTRVEYAPSSHTARLSRVLRRAGLSPWMLIAPSPATRRAVRTRAVARSLRVWARASRATRAHAQEPLPRLMTLAAHGLTPKSVWMHERPNRSAAPRSRRSPP